MNNPEKLLSKILSCVSTEELNTVIEKAGFSDHDWKPYGQREKNWDIVSNQQANAVGALTELITNSIDAVLTRKAYEAGINDLRADDAPQSMQEAVGKFYNVIEGKLSSLEAKQLKVLAEESILIGIKRKRKGGKFPTITVVDFGEGQTPEGFPKTFLSLSETNKEGIGFVQGKFNMGSTGSIPFCTESDIRQGHYKLIASKRYDGDFWAWTLIRVSQVQEGKKLPTVEYLIPNGEIQKFRSNNIKAFGDDEVGVIKQGTVVRLFDYDIGQGARDVDLGLYYALTLNLLECALPVRLYDFGAEKTTGKGRLREKGIADRTFSGMGVMLKADFKDPMKEDPDIPEEQPEKPVTEFVHLIAEDSSDPELGTFRVLGSGVSKLPQFLKNSKKRIFYTINGQTHATENASFLNSPRVKLGDLQNHLIVNIQCEKMDKTALTIFMGNREQKRNNNLSRKFVSLIQKHLSSDGKLKEYQGVIRRRRANQIIEENEETKRMLGDLITQDPAIKELLGAGATVPDIIQNRGGEKEWTGGKKFPTFLTPLNAKKIEDRYVKDLPINTHRQVKCGTDADNDYLTRSNSPGWVDSSLDEKELPRTVKLLNGTATFIFNPPADKKVGDEINLDIGFNDHNTARTKPLKFPLTIKIVEAEKTQSGGGGGSGGVKDKTKPAIADPTEWVHKKDWDEFGFNEKSGATISETENGIKIYVNYNHIRLDDMRAKEKEEDRLKLNESRFKICLGFLTLAVYKHYKNSEESDAVGKAEESSKAVAAYVLPLIRTLGGDE